METDLIHKQVHDRPDPELLEPLADGTDEWHEQRKKGIGGSDAGIVADVNPFSSRTTLWERKTGRDTPFEGNIHTEFGSRMEDFIRLHMKNSIDLFDLEMDGVYNWTELSGEDYAYKSPLFDWLRCNVDGVCGDDIVEIKTSTKSFSKIPDYHYAQMQHNLCVSGASRCAYIHFHPPGNKDWILEVADEYVRDGNVSDFLSSVVDAGKIEVRWVDHDSAYQRRLLELERDFWGCVERDDPPPEITPIGVEDGTDDEELRRLVREYKEAHRAIKKRESTIDLSKLEDRKEEAKEQIKNHMSIYENCDKVQVPEGSVGWIDTKHGGYWRVYV